MDDRFVALSHAAAAGSELTFNKTMPATTPAAPSAAMDATAAAAEDAMVEDDADDQGAQPTNYHFE